VPRALVPARPVVVAEGPAAGVTPIVLHGARQSYAEIALAAGVRLDVVSRTLGHASTSFTADQYSHDSDAAAVEAAEIVGRAIEGT
jgi:integrase